MHIKVIQYTTLKYKHPSSLFINYLHGSDRTLSGGGNSLLHATHVSGQSGLVTDGGRNTTEQSGHFRTGLSESENVVDEEQHVLAFIITEIFGYGQSGQADTGTGAWGLVHLSVHERDLMEREDILSE